jgi:hypothetical protein
MHFCVIGTVRAYLIFKLLITAATLIHVLHAVHEGVEIRAAKGLVLVSTGDGRRWYKAKAM